MTAVGRYGPAPESEEAEPTSTFGKYLRLTGRRYPEAHLLQYLAGRFKFSRNLTERDGHAWAASAGPYVRKQLYQSRRQYEGAVRGLVKRGLVAKAVFSLREGNPKRVTFLRITESGQELLGQIDIRLDAQNEHVDLLKTSMSICSKRASQTNSKTNRKDGKRLSLAPERERGDGEIQEGGSKKDEDGPRRAVERLWLDAHARHRPELPCSGFAGPKWKHAQDAADALGEQAGAVVDAVVRDWPGFRCFLINSVGARMVADEPEIACLAVHASAARRFLAEASRETGVKWAEPSY